MSVAHFLRTHYGLWLPPLAAVALLVALFFGCVEQSESARHAAGRYVPGEELAGGATTVRDVSRNAFGLSARNLTAERRGDFFVGNSFFNQNWVEAPASTAARDGLGPLFSARSCSSCHLRDGRGRPPTPGSTDLGSVTVNLSLPPNRTPRASPGHGHPFHGGPVPEPTYGLQFSSEAVQGLPPEGTMRVRYEEIRGQFSDGTPFALRRPRYTFEEANYGALADSLRFSVRVAPVLVGLGLLEAVSNEAILARADSADADGDGISGRPNYVWSAIHQERRLGRFGWKANQPSVREQVASAFLGDMGLTTPVFSEESCTEAQPECEHTSSGGQPEVDEKTLDQVVFYTQTLAVPARRGAQDPEVLRGKALFHEAQCASCHRPRMETGTLEGVPAVSGQTIYPYTDLLLHDMGPGLADGRADFEAGGREWRTPPLWGLGLISTVNGHTFLLHDGRARSIMEAILWHGGEAEASREAVRRMPEDERDALLAFLKSL